jgi:hypothetical protein
MSAFGKAKQIAGDLVGLGKQVVGDVAEKGMKVAGGVIGTVKDGIGGRGDNTVAETAADTPTQGPGPQTSDSSSTDDDVTPADVAEAASDPDLPHPERPTDEPPSQ